MLYAVQLQHTVLELYPPFVSCRLHQLEQQMVGGEEANNQTIKERRLKKKKHTEDYNKRLKSEGCTYNCRIEMMFNYAHSVEPQIARKNI